MNSTEWFYKNHYPLSWLQLIILFQELLTFLVISAQILFVFFGDMVMMIGYIDQVCVSCHVPTYKCNRTAKRDAHRE